MSKIEEYLMLFIESDEIKFENMPEGSRGGNGKKVEYLKEIGLVAWIASHEKDYPDEAWLLDSGLKIVNELRKRRKG
ncbi:hypothetical protein [Dyadobacter sp. 32]|uniref:hypothetical protein n=1 Tax=Dyadobacter sp. 32 TaxID=538966 RepID=UPI0011ED5500